MPAFFSFVHCYQKYQDIQYYVYPSLNKLLISLKHRPYDGQTDDAVEYIQYLACFS